MHWCVLKNKHLEVEGLLFYGKKGGSRQVYFTSPFPTHVHNVGSNLIISTLRKLFPFHLQAVHNGQVK